MAVLSTMLQLIGGATALSVTYQLSSWMYLYLRPSSLPRYHHGKTGSTWALVTGASDGIGFGFAEALCQRGFNVLLHGRNPEKLTKVKKTLNEKYPSSQVQIVIADASKYDADIQSVVSAAQTLPGKLTVLINNVGGVPFEPLYGGLHEVDQAHTDKIINLNLRFPTQLTCALLPTLIANEPSLVMNVSSMAALSGLPYLSIYSSAKAFNYTFSEGMRAEMSAEAENHDVEVLGIIVGNVMSQSNTVAVPLMTCDSAHMASSSLDRVGCGLPNVWGWWRHGVFFNVGQMLPSGLTQRETNKAIKQRKLEHEKGQ